MIVGTWAPGGRERRRPEKMTMVNMPHLVLCSPEVLSTAVLVVDRAGEDMVDRRSEKLNPDRQREAWKLDEAWEWVSTARRRASVKYPRRS